MYYYCETVDGKFVVGCRTTTGQFERESVFDSRIAAAERVNFLNGEIRGNYFNEMPMIQPSEN